LNFSMMRRSLTSSLALKFITVYFQYHSTVTFVHHNHNTLLSYSLHPIIYSLYLFTDRYRICYHRYRQNMDSISYHIHWNNSRMDTSPYRIKPEEPGSSHGRGTEQPPFSTTRYLTMTARQKSIPSAYATSTTFTRHTQCILYP
jgi:hypothetical protein